MGEKQILTLVCSIVILLGLYMLFGGKVDRFDKHYPNSYYDQGDWILNTSKKDYYTNKKIPVSGLRYGDLCQECIGHCQLKVWANVVKVPSGSSEKQFCTKNCQLECSPEID